jgi:hypothetical protein
MDRIQHGKVEYRFKREKEKKEFMDRFMDSILVDSSNMLYALIVHGWMDDYL